MKRLFDANPEIYRVISRISSVHIPKIFFIKEDKTELLIAEEYIGGRTLDEFFSEEVLSDVQKMELLIQVCEAMEALHGCTPPVIHRDIKPSNLMVDNDGVVKIIDFDASRQYKVAKISSDTRLLGTVEYAAPEQFGYAQTDFRSDIYSAGVVFSEVKMEEKAVRKEWKKLVDKCTSFDPENRYKDVPELKKDLFKCIRKIKQSAIKRMGIALAVGAKSAVRFVVGGIRGLHDKPTEGEAVSERVRLPEYNETDRIVLAQDRLYWNKTSLPVSVFVREGALCGIKKGYICRQAENGNPFSETITPITTGLYEVSEEQNELRIGADFFEEYGDEVVLYLEFSDGRGERVWLNHLENAN